MKDLTQWAVENGVSDQDIASQVNLTRSYISRVRAGTVNPSVEVAITLRDLTKGEVPIEMFLPIAIRPKAKFKRPRGRPWPSNARKLVENPASKSPEDA
jgi:transcriptional regulator with XRE-family HTH domain